MPVILEINMIYLWILLDMNKITVDPPGYH